MQYRGGKSRGGVAALTLSLTMALATSVARAEDDPHVEGLPADPQSYEASPSDSSSDQLPAQVPLNVNVGAGPGEAPARAPESSDVDVPAAAAAAPKTPAEPPRIFAEARRRYESFGAATGRPVVPVANVPREPAILPAPGNAPAPVARPLEADGRGADENNGGAVASATRYAEFRAEIESDIGDTTLSVDALKRTLRNAREEARRPGGRLLKAVRRDSSVR